MDMPCSVTVIYVPLRQWTKFNHMFEYLVPMKHEAKLSSMELDGSWQLRRVAAGRR